MNMHVKSEGLTLGDILASALANKPIKIEAGKFYRTRDGRKVGPMSRYSDAWQASSLPQYLWLDDGQRYYASDRGGGTDLIAEWPDEPRGCAAAQVDNLLDEYGPHGTNFKVGDRVRARDGQPAGHCGAVVQTPGDNAVLVEFDTWRDGHDGDGPHMDGRYWWLNPSELTIIGSKPEPAEAKPRGFKVGDRVRFTDACHASWWFGPHTAHKVGVIVDAVEGFSSYEVSIPGDDAQGYVSDEHIELIDPEIPTTPAIVAVLENGQPRPAVRPFVHPSRAAAEIEARRLADANKGKEFAVYELVSTAKVDKPAKVYDYEWQRLAVAGRKIDAIKSLRSAAGLYLKTAKDVVEDWLESEIA